ncbi:MAG: hypothetical protein ACXADH_04700 [Candidatus Kariarchaeaceae archaeon]|jgi:hypothetical protein
MSNTFFNFLRTVSPQPSLENSGALGVINYDSTLMDNTSLISEYMTIFHKYIDAPDTYALGSSIFLTSTLLGRFFKDTGTTNGLRPNVFILFSSIPGRMRRSTVINKAKLVYYHAYSTFLHQYPKPLRYPDQESSLTIKQFLQQSKVETGSFEGLIDHIQEAENCNEFAILAPEFGITVNTMHNKSYGSNVAQFYSSAYYGEEFTMHLSQRGGKRGTRYLRPNIYVTMLAAMQEPELYFKEYDFRQGIMRRIVTDYKPSNNNWKPPILKARRHMEAELKQLASKYADRMLKYRTMLDKYNVDYIPIQAEERVITSINRIAKHIDTQVNKNPSNFNIYRLGWWENAYKIAILFAIDRDAITIEPTRNLFQQTPLLHVTMEDYKQAVHYLREATCHSEDMIRKIGTREQPIRTQRRSLEYVYNIIYSKGRLGADIPTPYNETKLTKRNLQPLLDTLVSSNTVASVITGQRTRGRPKTTYYVTEFAPRAKPKDSKSDHEDSKPSNPTSFFVQNT